MKQKLGPSLTPFIASLVVMHGNIREMKLTADETKSVVSLSEFTALRFNDVYRQYFWSKPTFNPLDHLAKYDAFFQGEVFKPKERVVDGFRPDSHPIFEHPRKLYAEFRATAKDDPKKFALLRQWDFSALGTDLIGERERAFIGLREQRVFEHVSERNQELSLSMMRPVSRKTEADVTLDYFELFSLAGRLSRLAEFVHSDLSRLTSKERLALVKVVLHKFAELHDLNVAHRDVGEHSIWIDRPSRVTLSGFQAAYFPELRTVGAFRDKVKVEQLVLPEDTRNSQFSTPYRRDVFMLGVTAHQMLFGEKPPKIDGVFRWSPRRQSEFASTVDEIVARAIHEDPEVRFANAREMLEALNASQLAEPTLTIDLKAFDGYQAETKERDYDETVRFADSNEYVCFRSTNARGDYLVKVWYGVEPDSKQTDFSFNLLAFLEKARAVRGLEKAGLAKVFDFGLSRGSLLLVTEWVEGLSVARWLESSPALEARLSVCRLLAKAVARLHSLNLAHGDVHPENIIIGGAADPVLIDVLDFRKSGQDAYTTAYLPQNYKALGPAERDRYGLAAVMVDILGSTRAEPGRGEFPLPRVYEELASLISAETLSTLEPLSSALSKAMFDVPPAERQFTVVVPNLAYSSTPVGTLLSDNGRFYIHTQSDNRSTDSIRFRVTGVGRQLAFSWNQQSETAHNIRVVSVSQSQLLQSQVRDAPVPMRIDVEDGATGDAGDLALYLRSQLKLRATRNLNSDVVLVDGDTESANKREFPQEAGRETSIAGLWQSLLDAEEDAFFSVTVGGEKRSNPDRPGQLLIPYHTDSGDLNYERADTVVVETQWSDGNWRRCGALNLRDTTIGENSELAVEQTSARTNFSIGTRLRLISTDEKASYSRRRSAVDRILQGRAVIQDLISYFEIGSTSQTSRQFQGPTESDLDVYSSQGKGLNASQRAAFKAVLIHGPVSLLQGPPGTGKTWFIACLLHYLMTREGVRRILLVSQAHEAVNNALEKGMELCQTLGVEFNAVRLGAEAAASDSIRHLHTSAIEDGYRAEFKAEQKERIVELAATFGLPRAFTADVVDLHLRIGTLSDRIIKLQTRSGREDAAAIGALEARIRTLSETLLSIARDVYSYEGDVGPSEVLESIVETLIVHHEVTSPDAVARLRALIRLSEDWLLALGSSDANFSEFLAKSRMVVAGTLVGVGYRGAGVVQNVYDWVIIDEAGRAAPSELAVALQAGHRVLLVGDHLQLPPTFSDPVRKAVRGKYHVKDDSHLFQSDFERLFTSKYGQRVGASLLSQYRMAPAIGELVSTCFYDGRLETGRGSPPEYFDLLPDHLSKEVTWVDMSSFGNRAYEQNSPDGDTWNTSEASVVMRILRDLIESEEFMAFLAEDLGPQEQPIGIICMYSKQRALIDKLKSEATWLGAARRLVKVDTVDSYQGKENRIIIVSTVRNNAGGEVGFVKSPNRINVALSRAMERLFIVGASHMWRGRNSGSALGRVLQHTEMLTADGRASILPAGEFGERQ